MSYAVKKANALGQLIDDDGHIHLPEPKEDDNLAAALKVIAEQQRTIAQLSGQVESLRRDVDRYNEHVARALKYAAGGE